MDSAFPFSAASALAVVYVEKNAKEGTQPEELYKMYKEAFDTIRELEKQERKERYFSNS